MRTPTSSSAAVWACVAAGLRLIGGLPDDFFMQAEEYDLSLRLLNGGWRVQRFDDLHVTHLKTPRSPTARRARFGSTLGTTCCSPFAASRRVMVDHYLVDWTRRYFWIAQSQNAHRPVPPRTAAEGRDALADVQPNASPSPTRPSRIRQVNETRRRLHNTVLQHQAMRVLLVDAGKNLYAYWRACHENWRRRGRRRGQQARQDRPHVPRRAALPDAEARLIEHDICIIANLSPEHAKRRLQQWLAEYDRPTVDLFAELPEPQPMRIAA
ncbi:MAG: hypothetical protein QM754_10235 [Tepidisphaeraceae bacterium]